MKAFTWSAILGLGVVSALSAAFLFGEQENELAPKATRPAEAAEEGQEQVDTDDRTAALERELTRLRREVRQNGARLDARVAGEQPAQEVDAEAHELPERSLRSAEEEEELLRKRYADFERHHRDDPVDPSWAPLAEERLQTGLSALEEEVGIEVLETECKTEVCRAKVEWESYAAAIQTGGHLAEVAMPGLNCTQNIWLEEPSEVEAPYSTYLYLNCQELRTAALGTRN